VLEARLDALEGSFTAEGGGRGQPVLAERIFCGVEHPAGVNQGGPGWLRAVQLPGVELPPGGTFESESVVIGAAAAGEPVAAAFRSYVRSLRPRRTTRLRVTPPWLVRLTNPPIRPELTQELVDENVGLLETLRERGVASRLHARRCGSRPTFAPASARSRTAASGAPSPPRAHAGLWSATTSGVVVREARHRRVVAGGIAATEGAPAPHDESGQWSWTTSSRPLPRRARRP
jgi:hypothetical protein